MKQVLITIENKHHLETKLINADGHTFTYNPSGKNEGLEDFFISAPEEKIDFNGNQHSGMDLRDYFAAKAMQSMITAFYKKNTKEDPLEMFKILKLISKNSYWFADEMINKREKK